MMDTEIKNAFVPLSLVPAAWEEGPGEDSPSPCASEPLPKVNASLSLLETQSQDPAQSRCLRINGAGGEHSHTELRCLIWR